MSVSEYVLKRLLEDRGRGGGGRWRRKEEERSPAQITSWYLLLYIPHISCPFSPPLASNTHRMHTVIWIESNNSHYIYITRNDIIMKPYWSNEIYTYRNNSDARSRTVPELWWWWNATATETDFGTLHAPLSLSHSTSTSENANFSAQYIFNVYASGMCEAKHTHSSHSKLNSIRNFRQTKNSFEKTKWNLYANIIYFSLTVKPNAFAAELYNVIFSCLMLVWVQCNCLLSLCSI